MEYENITHTTSKEGYNIKKKPTHRDIVIALYLSFQKMPIAIFTYDVQMVFFAAFSCVSELNFM